MLPLHRSQQLAAYRRGVFADFSYKVCLTPELKARILALGPDVEVLEPLEYREKIKGNIQAMLERYKGGKIIRGCSIN